MLNTGIFQGIALKKKFLYCVRTSQETDRRHMRWPGVAGALKVHPFGMGDGVSSYYHG